jgi:hypothetical protein
MCPQGQDEKKGILRRRLPRLFTYIFAETWALASDRLVIRKLNLAASTTLSQSRVKREMLPVFPSNSWSLGSLGTMSQNMDSGGCFGN